MKYQDVFNEARDDLKREFGLELTLIELVRLRNYVKAAADEFDGLENKKGENS